MARHSRFSRAQFIVLFTLALPVLVAVIGFGADFAILYLNWANLQKAADSAALAGAEYLIATPQPPTPPPTAASCPAYTAGDTVGGPESVSCTYSVMNGAKKSEWSASVPAPNPPSTVPAGASTIQVILDRPDVSTYFLRLVGVDSLAAKAQATAVGPTTPSCAPLFPVALQCNSPCDWSSLTPGQPKTFGSKFVGGLANGDWQWTNVGEGTGVGSGSEGGLAAAIANNLPPYCVGDSITTDPGNKGASGNMKNALATRLASCPTLSASEDPCQNGTGSTAKVPSGDPCLITVPVIDFSGCNGACTEPIEGFAAIYLENTSTTAQINGCFVRTVDQSSYAGGGGTGPNLGVLTPPHLVQ